MGPGCPYRSKAGGIWGRLTAWAVRPGQQGRRGELFYSYRSPVDRKKRPLRLGAYGDGFGLADAVSAWKAAAGKVAEGIDPHPRTVAPTSKRVEAYDPLEGAPAAYHALLRDLFGPDLLIRDSFGDLARDFLVLHAWPEKRRTRDDEGMLRRDLLPRWRDKAAASIGQEEVIELTDAIIAKRDARRSAEHVRLLISRIYNHGIKRARRLFNPASHVSISGGKP